MQTRTDLPAVTSAAPALGTLRQRGQIERAPDAARLPPARTVEPVLPTQPVQPVLRLLDVGIGDSSLSLTTYSGEIVHLGGGSPAVRLRVLTTAAGYRSCSSGRCELLGSDMDELEPDQRRALRERHVSRVLAGDKLPEAATVLAAVALPLVRQGVSLVDARARAALELDALGCMGLADCRPEKLRSPDIHLVLLARALVMRPRLLVLEEPEAGLSPTAVSSLRLALWALSSAFETCVLMTTGHPRLLASADRFIDLDGRTSRPLLMKKALQG